MGRYGRNNSFYVDIMSMQKEVTGNLNMCVISFPNGGRSRFIVDCGIFQEQQHLNENDVFPFNPENYEFAILTHNHADHFGRFPLLFKKGFKGKIHTTTGTSILLPPALRDAGKIEKLKRRKPLYSRIDVDNVFSNVSPHEYRETFQASPNINITFFENGHLPGAALTLVEINYTGYKSINLLFTGDYNNKSIFVDVPELPQHVLDLPITIIQECTYGTQSFKSEIPEQTFENNIVKTIKNSGIAAIMALSQGRTQEVLYKLKEMQDQKVLDSSVPIFLDGNLSKTYTEIFRKANIGIKESMRNFIPYNFSYIDKGIRRSIISDNNTKIIVTSAGMGRHGPAQQYIPAFLSNKKALLQFTSFLPEGTVGRKLKESVPEEPIELYGRVFSPKKAQIEFSEEFSSHAKPRVLYEFLKKFNNLQMILLNHGSYEAKETYGFKLNHKFPKKEVGLLGQGYIFRINSEGYVKSINSKF